MKPENRKDTGGPIRTGMAAAWPVSLGYVPIGLAFGVLAQKAGLSPAAIALMSVLVFAGSSQFIAVSMITAGASPFSIIVTTFMINFRHFLMSSSLAVFLAGESRRRLSLFAYGVTDESFAVNLSRFRQGGWALPQALAMNHTANLVWIASTVAGGYGGQFIPPHAWGIDYALIAMFICLLVFQLRGLRHVIAALAAGSAAVVFSLFLPGNLHVILASVIAATAAMLIQAPARRLEADTSKDDRKRGPSRAEDHDK